MNGLMERLLLPGIGLLLAALGARVVLRARGGTLSELAVGVWFLGIGVGLPILHRASVPGAVSPQLAPLLVAGAQALVAVAFCGLYLFAWRTFGPDCGWRRSLALAGVGACLATWLGIGWFEGFAPRGGGATLTMAATRAAGVVWAFVETSAYALRMRRRTRIGLADPVVANRFALWAVWMGMLLLGMGLTMAVRWMQIEHTAGRPVMAPGAIVALTRVGFAGFGLVAATAMWLSFFPPLRYQSWLRARA